MRPGGGKGKGSGFERQVCKHLSLWISQGAREDVFWRSAMSGGRGTLLSKKAKQGGNVAGDITATAKEGHLLTDPFFVECKFYAKLDLTSFLLGLERGALHKFWAQAEVQAKSHNKAPLLIGKQNLLPPFVLVLEDTLPLLLQEQEHWPPAPVLRLCRGQVALYWFESLFPLPQKANTQKPSLRRPKK
jgi:hypothetical protein